MTDPLVIERLLEELYAARAEGHLDKLCGLIKVRDARITSYIEFFVPS